MTDLGCVCMCARKDGALSARRVMFAAVSTRAVLLRHGGLVQPGKNVEEHINGLLILLYVTLFPAGVPRQDLGVHLTFA
jgi:hypothetical protein